LSERFIQSIEAKVLGATDLDPDLLHVVSMERDEVAEQLRVARLARDRGLLTIDPELHVERPFLGIFAAQKRLIEVLPLATDLGSPRTGF